MFEQNIPELKTFCVEATKVFTKEHRYINCIEELSELQKCITKILSNGNWKLLKHNTINEIADCYITIDITDNEIFEVMKFKLNHGVR